MTGPVIAIASPPGGGKTTLGRWLTQTYGAARVDYDDYETITQLPPNEIADWLARGSPINEIAAPGLPEAVAAAAGQGVVVFEMPLGREWGYTSKLIDTLIWIDTPLDLALSRRLAGMAKSATENGENRGDFAGWVAGYLDAYESVTRPLLLVQNSRVKAGADIVISNDGTLDSAMRRLNSAVGGLLR